MAKKLVRTDLWSFLVDCIPTDRPVAMIEIEAAASATATKLEKAYTNLIRGYLNAGITMGIVETVGSSPVKFRRLLHNDHVCEVGWAASRAVEKAKADQNES